MTLILNPRLMETVRWSTGSCGDPGCAEPECVCGLCAQPIGIPEWDPRRETHDDFDCMGCPLCEDDVPIMLFRIRKTPGGLREASFHARCFNRLVTGNK